MIRVGFFAGAVLAAGAALWALHRFCLYLEERGLLYYRRRGPGSAGFSALQEIDRLTRPSIEHVEQVHDEIVAGSRREHVGE